MNEDFMVLMIIMLTEYDKPVEKDSRDLTRSFR